MFINSPRLKISMETIKHNEQKNFVLWCGQVISSLGNGQIDL